MQALLDVILPVFCLIGFGYIAVWRGYFSNANVDGLMKFTQNFAIPCLLFSAIAKLDLAHTFDWRLLLSFYTGAGSCFFLGLFGAHYGFGSDWEDSVAIAFCCLFSNSLMLGLPITERAFGPDALKSNYAIVALHSPFCYGLGITTMEIVRAKTKSPAVLFMRVGRAMFRNALVIGIVLGFVVNLGGIPLPGPITGALDLMVRAALPAALFGLGGVLVQYRPEGDIKVIMMVVMMSLVLHPTIVWGMGRLNGLGVDAFRSAVLTAAVAPGVNSYVFASMYGKGMRVAASAILLGTSLCVLTVWLWLAILP